MTVERRRPKQRFFSLSTPVLDLIVWRSKAKSLIGLRQCTDWSWSCRCNSTAVSGTNSYCSVHRHAKRHLAQMRTAKAQTSLCSLRILFSIIFSLFWQRILRQPAVKRMHQRLGTRNLGDPGSASQGTGAVWSGPSLFAFQYGLFLRDPGASNINNR